MKRHGRQIAPVDRAVGIEDFASEFADDVVVGFAAGLLHLPAELIGLDEDAAQFGAEVDQGAADESLAAGEPSGQTDAQHGGFMAAPSRPRFSSSGAGRRRATFPRRGTTAPLVSRLGRVGMAG